jgi:lantibiotic modifying enzyme
VEGDGVVDQLCCGVFGRVDFLLEAARRLGNPSLEDAARRMARRAIERAHGGGFRVAPPEHEPGLWQGLAGIGYELLRLSAPERFPSVLLLD